jgi:threonine/homoserine/homoserine lactone efflux protein
MPLLLLFCNSFLLALSGALAPGPLLAYNIQLSLKEGFWTGPKLILGHAILEAALIIGLFFGLGWFLKMPATQITLWIGGGLLLLWMGYDLVWVESRKDHLNPEPPATSGRSMTDLPPVWAGIVVSLSNPYWSIWWAVVGLGLLTTALDAGWLAVAVFFTGHILADLLWYSLVAAAVARGRAVIPALAYKVLFVVCGLFLWYMAGRFLFDAVKAMVG